MLDTGIDISGLKAMEKALLEIAKEVGAKKATGMMTNALRTGGKEYEKDMKQNATESEFARVVTTQSGSKVEVRPGFLKSRIKTKGSTNGKGAKTKRFGEKVVSLVKVGIFKVAYLVQYEYGTSKTKENPIIRNAFKNKTNVVISLIQRKLSRNIELAQKRIAKKHGKS